MRPASARFFARLNWFCNSNIQSINLYDLSTLPGRFIPEIRQPGCCEKYISRFNGKAVKIPSTGGHSQSSVLILLFERNGETHILFIRRSDTVRLHKGEIAFPGGIREPGDPSLEATVLRETMEETGLNPGCIRIIAESDDFITPYHFHITPFIGITEGSLTYTLNLAEVAETIEIPLVSLFNGEYYRTGYRFFHGRLYNLHFFRYQHHVIWGITGHILFRFLTSLYRSFSETN